MDGIQIRVRSHLSKPPSFFEALQTYLIPFAQLTYLRTVKLVKPSRTTQNTFRRGGCKEDGYTGLFYTFMQGPALLFYKFALLKRVVAACNKEAAQ